MGAEEDVLAGAVGAGGQKFLPGLNGLEPVPYRVNEWHGHVDPILIPEGEKHVDRLTELGFVATCNPMGAGKWRACYSDYFRTADAVILPDNDQAGRAHARQVAEALLSVAASVRVLEFSGVPDKGDVIDWLNNDGTAEALSKLIAAAPDAQVWLEANSAKKKVKAESTGTPYFIRDGGLWRTVQAREGPTATPLTNFTAEITGEVVRDDGVETVRQLEIEARVKGQTVRFAVPAAEYTGMAWAARELGGRAHVFPGQGTKDHARFAIQVLSPDYAERRVFVHTGWRVIDGCKVYLHGGGAIGAAGLRADVETELGNELERFTLPAPGDPRVSLRLLDLAPLEAMVPLLALVYRAPICASDITLHVRRSYRRVQVGGGGARAAALRARNGLAAPGQLALDREQPRGDGVRRPGQPLGDRRLCAGRQYLGCAAPTARSGSADPGARQPQRPGSVATGRHTAPDQAAALYDPLDRRGHSWRPVDPCPAVRGRGGCGRY